MQFRNPAAAPDGMEGQIRWVDQRSISDFSMVPAWALVGLWSLLWLSLNSGPIQAPPGSTEEAWYLVRSIAPVLSLVFGILLVYRQQKRRISRGTPGLWLLLAYALVGLLGTFLASPNVYVGVHWGILFASAILVTWILHDHPPGTHRLQQLNHVNYVFVAGLAALFSYLAITELGLLDLLLHGNLERLYETRPVLISDEFLITSNGVGRFVALLALISLSRGLAAGARRRWPWLLVVTICIVLLTYTISRTSILAFAVATLVVVWIHQGSKRLLYLLTALLLVSAPLAPRLISYFERGQTADIILSFGNRAPVWSQALDQISGSPVIGFGFHADRLLLQGEHIHNAWIHALLQAGILGFILFVAAWAITWRFLFGLGLLRRFKGRPRSQRLVLAELAAFLVFFTVRTLTESSGAFFGVDLILLLPVFALIGRSRASAPTPHAKRRILVTAFAATPPGDPNFTGGEDHLGWNLVQELAKNNDTWVLTTPLGRERKLEAGQTSLVWAFVDMPKFMNAIRWKWGTEQLYAYLWQIRAYFFADRLHHALSFDLVHHLTYANDWMAAYPGALLPTASIRGPGGGAHRVPRPFHSHYGRRFARRQRVRSILQVIFRLDPVFLIGQERAHALLVCNREAMARIPRTWQRKAEYFPVNGVNAADFRRESSPANVFSIVTAGKLVDIKGHDLVLRAFARARPHLGAARLVIVGDGPRRESLGRLAAELGVSHAVEFTGWLPREDVLSRIAAAHVFAFGGLSDGGGAVVVEAMAQGVPVVCLDLAGPGFHIDHDNGIKVRPGNPQQVIEDLAFAFRRVRWFPGLRRTLGRNARERARDEYQWDRLGDRLERIYQQCLDDSASPAQKRRSSVT